MKSGDVLDIVERYLDFCAEPSVIAEAKEIVLHGAPNGRTRDERFSDAHKGLAVQYAVAEVLEAQGFVIELNHDPKDFWYDFKINGVSIDVKSRWEGRYWSQSPAEHAKIKELNARVLYLCIDHMPKEGTFVYRGACWSDSMSSSQFGGQYATISHFAPVDLETLLRP
jgi:hypothetical protein